MTQPLPSTVPLVIYIDGERKVIGTAIVQGDKITTTLNDILDDEVLDIIARSGPNEFSLGPVIGMHGFNRFHDDVPKIQPERIRLKGDFPFKKLPDLDYSEIIQKDFEPEENPDATFWNGLPTPAIRGTAIVAPSPQFPEFWGNHLVGKRIEVVRVVLDGVNFGGGISYIDNRDGSGWLKVTKGHGSPRYGHRDLNIEEGTFELHKENPNVT